MAARAATAAVKEKRILDESAILQDDKETNKHQAKKKRKKRNKNMRKQFAKCEERNKRSSRRAGMFYNSIGMLQSAGAE
jgi:Flp pilus assembly protein TadB